MFIILEGSHSWRNTTRFYNNLLWDHVVPHGLETYNLEVKYNCLHMAYYIPQIIYTAFFWEWRQKDLFGFQSHSFISWDERWRTCFEVWGHISLSVRPLLFHPRLLSRASLQCLLILLHNLYMKSLIFVHRQDSHRMSPPSGSLWLLFLPEPFISLRGRRSRCIHANQGASGNPWKLKGLMKQALCEVASHACQYVFM